MAHDGIEGAEIIYGQPTQLPGLMTNVPTPQKVAAFMGRSIASAEDVEPHLWSAISLVRAYTRGVGFAPTDANEAGILCREDIASVIIATAARSAANPTQATREEIGSWSAVYGKFDGFTLAEQFVLNQYRRRTA